MAIRSLNRSFGSREDIKTFSKTNDCSHDLFLLALITEIRHESTLNFNLLKDEGFINFAPTSYIFINPSS
ncbi:hypothetical protein GA0061101_110137 [Rhizobium lusitanum]|uniref:Uncharacterized protein n=1 Tax=Rhizobium lusitanum TaxID=293958 RepID=A0A1C3WE28_9HYPH|nr:hypothetical protein GA0061101_110137 [Rhizobium lusitanum]